MTEASKFLLGRRNLFSEEEIIAWVKNSKRYDPAKENLEEANTLLIFQTGIQQTWLVATNARLYNILDDVRKDTPHINWSIPQRRFQGPNALQIEARSYKERTGLVDFGDRHRNWLYSTDLFEKKSIEESIVDLFGLAAG